MLQKPRGQLQPRIRILPASFSSRLAKIPVELLTVGHREIAKSPQEFFEKLLACEDRYYFD